ncbi:DUF3737 family protein [Clostridium sp. SYSU_GA19001]|uniref:DUF3737 family protein n=1 Tax=Clostridium caldaquaticum TaxID=2940653 RepID=UPI0020770203|nr:DUF3737 family protein [Clostridium caldaquaticum]MCM8709922.1 DUF3737 family protein [Clostridium caldaquaticum]
MELVQQKYLTGERALFKSKDLKIIDCTFAEGESPLKESENLIIENSIFKWKYPLWYCSDVTVLNSTLLETARSGIWYTKNINIKESTIEAPKTFRRSKNITLENVSMPISQETLWNCEGIKLTNVTARGDYFGMNSKNIKANNFHLTGNYAFDGCKNIEIYNAKMLSKDAFWNCEDVVVYDSLIIGEYLGWNSKNLTFINCTIDSLQGLCYIENLVLKNCKLLNTTLAFEYSTVNAEVISNIDSVMNPISGIIKAKSIGELILDETKINPEQTKIITLEDY